MKCAQHGTQPDPLLSARGRLRPTLGGSVINRYFALDAKEKT